MSRRRVLIAVFALLMASCSALKDAREPWEADLRYEDVSGAAVAEPATLRADGPFGRVQVSNFTQVKRGFAIEELAIYEQILPDRTLRVVVDEARDGKTYAFYDHLHPKDGPRGKLVVRFVKPEEQ